MDQAQAVALLTRDERPDGAEPGWFSMSDELQGPFEGLPPELQSGAFKPRNLDGSPASLRTAISELVDLKAVNLIVLFALCWPILGVLLYVMLLVILANPISLAIEGLFGLRAPVIFDTLAAVCLAGAFGIVFRILLPYFREAVSNRDKPVKRRIDWILVWMAALPLGFVAYSVMYVVVSGGYIGHIRNLSHSELTWRDRCKLRRITRGVSLPNDARQAWARDYLFSPDSWVCVTFRCGRVNAVRFVEQVADKPLREFKTTLKDAKQESRFSKYRFGDSHANQAFPWRDEEITDIRFVEFPPSAGGVAIDLTTNTVFVIRD